MATTTSSASIKSRDYLHSPVHFAVALGDQSTLAKLVYTVPKLADPTHVRTESDSLTQEKLADRISALVDRRDVPSRETPLHLAVRLNDYSAVKALAAAGADVSLQNSAGWNPLQEALCRRNSDIALILLKLHHRSAWAKWRRRLPRLIAVLHRMRDFYMEISFHFESSVIPFVGKIAPSDTYKIWKRDGNLRADTSLAGFDGLKIQRADQSFLFFGDGDQNHNVPSGSLLVLNHDSSKIYDAFENAGAPMTESDIAGFYSQTTVYRPGMDVTQAQLVPKTNWRRQDKIESVGDWKAKVHEIHNVVFSFRSRKFGNSENDVAGSEQVLPLELDEDDDEFLIAENPSFRVPDKRRHSSFVREDRDSISVGRKSVDIIPSSVGIRDSISVGRKSVDIIPSSVGIRDSISVGRKSVDIIPSSVGIRDSISRGRKSVNIVPSSASLRQQRRPTVALAPAPPCKEKEFIRSLRPTVWLTEQFPLKIEELLPLLDILANKVKAVRRMRELLTTKFPSGTFPVKVAIPVVPTVRVVVTFSKFEELQPTEQFYTPPSSPGHCLSDDDQQKLDTNHVSSSSWLLRNNGHSSSGTKNRKEQLDPFVIPSGYKWSRSDEKSSKTNKSKSTRKNK